MIRRGSRSPAPACWWWRSHKQYVLVRNDIHRHVLLTHTEYNRHVARIDRDSSRCLHRLHRACNSRSALPAPRAALPSALAQAWRDLASRKAASSSYAAEPPPDGPPWLWGFHLVPDSRGAPERWISPRGPGALRRAGSVGGKPPSRLTRSGYNSDWAKRKAPPKRGLSRA